MVGFCFTTVIIVTFDGYANHYDRAARILNSLGFRPSFSSRPEFVEAALWFCGIGFVAVSTLNSSSSVEGPP
jgi:hypothetical protein